MLAFYSLSIVFLINSPPDAAFVLIKWGTSISTSIYSASPTYSSFIFKWFFNLISFYPLLNYLLSFRWLALFSIFWPRLWTDLRGYFFSKTRSSQSSGGSSPSYEVSLTDEGLKEISLKYLFFILTYFPFLGFFYCFFSSCYSSVKSLSYLLDGFS